MKPFKSSIVKDEKIVRSWHLVDLSTQTLGRACTQIAQYLMGKNKAGFSYHQDQGDYVVAINVSKIKTTGNKLKDKVYYYHTAYSGHLKSYTLGQLLKDDPKEVLRHGVYGMIPKNRLRDVRMTRLKIFIGSEHPYQDKLSSKK